MEVIMARITAARQSEHLCLRMTCDQLKELELAANLSGVNLSQRALENLLSYARETIAPNNRTIMAAEDFDTFVEALYKPMNPTLRSFIEQKNHVGVMLKLDTLRRLTAYESAQKPLFAHTCKGPTSEDYSRCTRGLFGTVLHGNGCHTH